MSNRGLLMAQQNSGGFGVAHPVQYSPPGEGIRDREVDIKDPQDNAPSDVQPSGVDNDDMPQSLEEALLG
jgi:hypothetical protein